MRVNLQIQYFECYALHFIQTKCHLWFLFKIGVNSKKAELLARIGKSGNNFRGFQLCRIFSTLNGMAVQQCYHQYFCLQLELCFTISAVVRRYHRQRWCTTQLCAGDLIAAATVLNGIGTRCKSFANVETFLTKLLIFCRTFSIMKTTVQ